MTRARQDRLITLLLAGGGWSTATTLADRLGVTPRSIRAYVSALNTRVPGDAVESGPLGYRAGPDAAAALRSAGAPTSPRDRLHTLVRALLAAPEGLELAVTARALHVSEATLDADLGRVRSLLAGSDVALAREGERARLVGTERAQRRLVSQLAHDELDASGSFAPEALRRVLGDDEVAARALAAFRAELVTGLGTAGYAVNEIGLADVMLHIAIAADRVAHDRPLGADADGPDPGAAGEGGAGNAAGPAGTADGAGDAAEAAGAAGAADAAGAAGIADAADAAGAPVADLVELLARRHLGIRLAGADRDHLAALVLTRVAAPRSDARERLDPSVERAVREVVQSAAAEFDVDIDDDDFALRLALHVQNLVHRSRTQAWSRNPLTASLKSTHPMIFEIAVFVAGGLGDRLDIPVPDDEIAYIAMHIGGRLERGRRADPLPTAAVVSPGYYDLHELLRAGIDRSLGRVVEVTDVVTRADPDWEALTADIVLTTIEPPVPGERTVRITPFLTDADVERVQTAAARVRRARRLARLREELTRYLDERAFAHGVSGSPEEVIRSLGGLLVAQGVIDDGYVERTIERERLSPTAFTDALAVPHSLTMTATRTAIAIGIADPPIAWGSERVQVIALVAFSESDRAAFQTVLEQFVEVFAEPGGAQRIVRRAATFAGFVDELAAVIDG